ncbi:MAG: hypothetical protein DCC51_11345 [Anaerolineae bacterium]|nr:MAG: hypothetical protein DCC51_11345 [Anaerolineae bacterium]
MNDNRADIRSGRGVLLVAAFLLILMTAACSAGAGGSAAPPAEEAQTGEPAALPGTEEFGLTREELVTRIEAVEGLVAQCMSEAGFEYVAADYDTVRQGMVADKSLPGLSEEEFIAQYGYGISTLYTGLGPQASDATTPAKIGLGERNVAIYNNLSPADQVAYNRALFGENQDATFAVALEAEDFSRTGGCTRAAIEQVFAPEQLTITYANPLDALIQQDPRMVAAFGEYADCIREAGFDYTHPEQIEADIRSRVDAITSGDPLDALSADAMTALTELQGEERAVAQVAFDCEEEFLTPVEELIQRELYARPVQ